MVTAPSLFDIFAAVIFCIALLHTFSASFFTRLAHRYHTHSGLFHLRSGSSFRFLGVCSDRLNGRI